MTAKVIQFPTRNHDPVDPTQATAIADVGHVHVILAGREVTLPRRQAAEFAREIADACLAAEWLEGVT